MKKRLEAAGLRDDLYPRVYAGRAKEVAEDELAAKRCTKKERDQIVAAADRILYGDA